MGIVDVAELQTRDVLAHIVGYGATTLIARAGVSPAVRRNEQGDKAMSDDDMPVEGDTSTGPHYSDAGEDAGDNGDVIDGDGSAGADGNEQMPNVND